MIMPSDASFRLGRGDALLLVDVQNDFLPGGALAVHQGDRILAPVNRLLGAFERHGLPVVATRDWHPPEHCSFRDRGGPWPPHCVAGTHGAAFPEALALPARAHIVSKAQGVDQDAYSGFQDTGLADWLRAAGVRRLVVAGLATDYCVLNTVRDACAAGFEVRVVTDAIRAVEVNAGDGERALASMIASGARLLTSAEVA